MKKPEPGQGLRKAVNLTLAPEVREMLNELSHDERLSMSQWIETVVRREYQRKYGR